MAENKEVKRLNYFTSQFLQEDDFNDEQAYHIRMRRLHNRALHTWGVVEGLVVSLVPGSKSVAITPGTAIDNAGKEIVLPSDPAPQPIDLSAVTKGTDVFITIAYNEVDDPADKYTTAGVEGKYERKTERPLLKPDASPLNDGSVIILAKVSVDINSNVGNPDNTVRRLASAALAPATDLEVRSLKWGNNSRLQVDQGGSIELGGDNNTAGTGTPYIDFHFSGKREDFNTRIINEADGRLSLQAPVVRATGSVGIGTPTPATQLHIRKDAANALGPIITLMNGGGSPGAGASIDFDGYDTAANAPSLRIQSLDDGSYSSHLSILTKKPGANTNSLEERLRITSSGSVGIGTPTPGARLTVQQGGTSSVAAANGKGLFVSALMGTGAASDGGIEFRHDNLSQGIGFGYNTIYATGSNANQDLSIQSRGTGSVLLNPTSGNVGIGAASAPIAKLQVTGGAIMPAIGNNEQSGIQFPPDPGVGTGDRAFIRYYVESGTETTKLMIGVANDSDDAIGFTQFGAERMTIYNGNVGIGTTNPQAKLEVSGAIRAGNSDIYFTKIDHVHTGIGNTVGFAAIENAIEPYNALMILGRMVPNVGRVVKMWDQVEIAGNLGTHGYTAAPKKASWGGGIHTWDIEVEGTLWARATETTPHDIAENYLSDADLAAGDVVCLDKGRDRIVQSDKANDVLLIGVISTEPGMLLNAMHAEEDSVPGMLPYPVALCGRVPCKVTDENGPIERGDLLTTSSTAGHAMKATPVRVEGIDVYRPGTVIGKALERHKSGKGMIEVFVALR